MMPIKRSPDRAHRSAARIAWMYTAFMLGWLIITHQIAEQLVESGIASHWLIDLLYIAPATIAVYVLSRNELGRVARLQRHYSTLFESSHDSLIAIDTSGHCIEANSAALSLTGYTRDELIGRSLLDLLVPEDRATVAPHLAQLATCGGKTLIQQRLLARDGTIRYVEVVVSRLDQHQKNTTLLCSVRDVTTRMHTDAELRRSESVMRAILDNAQQVIILVDESFTIAAANRFAERDLPRIFGQAPTIGQSILDLLPPHLRDGLHRRLEQAMSGDEFSVEHYIAGVEMNAWWEFHISPITQADGGVNGAVLTARDVTKRKHAEDQLKRTSEHLRAVVENAPMTLFAFDAEGRFTVAMGRFREVIGIVHESLLGHPLKDFVADERLVAALNRALAGEAFTTEIVWRSTVFEARWEPQFSGDRVSSVICVATDVTDRYNAERTLRQIEAREQAILNGIVDAVFLKDGEGRYLLANPSTAQILGCHPDDLVGKRDDDLFPPPIAAARRTSDQQVIDSGATVQTTEYLTIANGQRRLFHSFKSPYRDEHGAIGVICISRDITEGSQIHDALRESERMLSTLISNLPGVAYRCRYGSHWTDEFISDRVQELTGYPAGAFLNREISLGRLMDPDAREQMRRAVEQSLLDRRPFQMSYRITTRDGQEKWVWEQGQAIFDEEGTPIAFEGFISDITERRHAEDALRKSEATNRALLDAMPDLMFRMNRDAVFLDYHAPQPYDLKVPPQEFLGSVIDDVLPPPIATATREYLRRALDSGETQLFEYEMVIADEPRDYEARLAVSGEAEILALVRDITERKRLERKLTAARDIYLTLVEETPMLVWRTDPRGQCDFVNRRWTTFTGKPAEESFGIGWASAIHPDDREDVLSHVRTSFFNRDPFTIEFRMLRADGSFRWLVAQGTPFYADNGEYGGFVGTCLDIHERKQQEIIKDDFLALASHELKTPLAALMGYVYLLQRWSKQQSFGERIENALGSMIEEGGRLDRLINDLLDVSRIQLGKLRLIMRPIDLTEVVTQVIHGLQLALADHMIELDQQVQGPLQITGDQQRLEQVIVNLCTNAAKYSPPSSLILVQLYVRNGLAHLVVTDRGLGIPNADLPYIFDRFYQVQRPTRESRPGLGLGLFIANQIVRQHGGAISVASAEYHGSSFTVQLPIVSSSQEYTDVLTSDRPVDNTPTSSV